LVEIGGTPLLEQNIETFRDAGVTDHLVVTGYEADRIRETGYETVHNPVYDETDMVYSLFCAESEFPSNGDLIISYGDIIYEQAVVDDLLACDASISVVVDLDWQSLWERRFEDPLSDAETLRFGDDQLIQNIGDDPSSLDQIDGQYVGLLKIDADIVGQFSEKYRAVDADSDGRRSVEMTHFLQDLIDDGWSVRAVPIEGGWLEVDTVSDLELYRELNAADSLDEFVRIQDDRNI
jgi:choline kinase